MRRSDKFNIFHMRCLHRYLKSQDSRPTTTNAQYNSNMSKVEQCVIYYCLLRNIVTVISLYTMYSLKPFAESIQNMSDIVTSCKII